MSIPKSVKAASGLAMAAALTAGLAFGGHIGKTQLGAGLASGTAWNSTSDNWSGYALSSDQTGTAYTSASQTWVIPSVSTLRTRDNQVGCAAVWTGIGGMTSKDLIQLGTDSCADSTETGYYAWYEILPAAGTPIQSLKVSPGDVVTASLRLVSGTPVAKADTLGSAVDFAAVVKTLEHSDPGFSSAHVVQELRRLIAEGESALEREPWWPAVRAELSRLFSTPAPAPTTTSTQQEWLLSFVITSPSGSVERWSKTIAYQSSMSSVEWITEAPTDAKGVQPLPNYGVTHFQAVSANGSAPSFSPADQIELGDPHGEASIPSAPVGNSDAFNTCYFPTFHVSACTAP